LISFSLIIVNYKSSDYLLKCLKSIYENEKENNFNVIVVDNASKDNSAEVIKGVSKTYKNFSYEILDEKKSFSYANNLGIKRSNAEFIVILNPDIVLNDSTLERLKNNFNINPKLGAVSPYLIGTDKKFQNRYFQKLPSVIQFVLFYSFLAKLFEKSKFLKNKFLYNLPESDKVPKMNQATSFAEVVQIPCAFFMTKKEVLNNIGLLDEDYNLFFEDVDLSFRISSRYKIAVDTSVKVTHFGGSSFSDENSNNYWMYGRFIMSMNLFFDKHYHALRNTLFKLFCVTNSLLLVFAEFAKGIFGKRNSIRILKHKFFLKEFVRHYF